MNLSTPFSMNIISQMRAEQWRRPEELGSSLAGWKRKLYIKTVQRGAMRNLIDGEICWCVSSNADGDEWDYEWICQTERENHLLFPPNSPPFSEI